MGTIMQNDKKKIINILIYTIVFFSLMMTAFIFVQFSRFTNDAENKKQVAIETERNLVTVEQRLMQKELKRIISDLFIIKSIVERNIDEAIQEKDYTTIVHGFASIVENKKIYDQMRYIDQDGKEIVRIDMETDGAVTAKNSKLQNKSNRYYFKETMAIKKKQIYISRLDLNVENGKIEMPIKPMIRIACKVYDKEGNNRGIVILNYYASEMINDFNTIAENSNACVYLINSKGYYLSNASNKDSEFSFMYEDKEKLGFFSDFPNVWQKLLKEEQSKILSPEDIFFARPIIPLKEEKLDNFMISFEDIVLGEGNLWVVSHISKSDYPQAFDKTPTEKLAKIWHDDKLDIILIAFFAVNFAFLYNGAKNKRRQMKFEAERDSLTDTFNRRAGMSYSKKSLKKNQRLGNTCCITFMDINGLKTVNDKIGHKAGDALIVSFSKIVNSMIKNENKEIFFRYGGDEFVLFQANKTKTEAEKFWQELKNKITEINNSNQHSFNISISHGISEITKRNKVTALEKYIDQADENMYAEKTKVKKTAIIIKKR